MNFQDIGIIIAKKPLKESLQLITVFTKTHGLYSGVRRSGSRKISTFYNEGNLVDFSWTARLHEHIGSVKCELIKSYSGTLITDKTRLYAFNSIVDLLKLAFHEREPHNNFFPEFEEYLQKSAQAFSIYDYIKLELAILGESGYELQLDRCAVTGNTQDLYYVSPRSGKVVSKQAGEPYIDKLLRLPAFLTCNSENKLSFEEIRQAFDLTGYFFNRYFFHNHQQPKARQAFMEHILSISF